MTHDAKLRVMRTALGLMVLAIVLWVGVQLAISTNATAAIEEREDWCLVEGVSDCHSPEHDAAFEARDR